MRALWLTAIGGTIKVIMDAVSKAPGQPSTFRTVLNKLYILEVPHYGNRIFYSLGFLALTCLATLAVSGIIMVFFGPTWWLTTAWGVFLRSVHLWATEAFVLIIILHGLVVFSTSAFKKPRRLTWVLGSLAFVLVLAEAEFGYGIRGDFSSQYRMLQAADFFNGAYLGHFINTLNQAQIYGIHIVVIPLIIVTLIACHYLLVKTLGIARPYRADVPYKMVPAEHAKLYRRGGILLTFLLCLAFFFPSPLILPMRVSDVANESPSLMAQTLMQEFTQTSNTATYLDSIDPYTYDTRSVYIATPYQQYRAADGGIDALAAFAATSTAGQQAYLDQATAYFANGGAIDQGNKNPLILAVSSLVVMAQSGLYQASLDAQSAGNNQTYSLRFLSDTGVLYGEAQSLHITTDQWGMMHEEKGVLPPGAWWLAPLGILDHTVLANDANGDRDGAEILGFLALLLVLFPFIPYLNRLPEKIGLAKKIWGKPIV